MPGKLPKKSATTEVLEARPTVTVERSFTKNMQNFNSAKVTVILTVPIDPTKEELEKINKTVRIANQECEKFLEEELDKLQV